MNILHSISTFFSTNISTRKTTRKTLKTGIVTRLVNTDNKVKQIVVLTAKEALTDTHQNTPLPYSSLIIKNELN